MASSPFLAAKTAASPFRAPAERAEYDDGVLRASAGSASGAGGAVAPPAGASFSMYSSASAAVGAGNSRAVLAALRALQDKIRRLEGDRDAATAEAQRLREELASQAARHDHSLRMAAIAQQERGAASRLAYERLAADKARTDAKLAKAEEQKAALVKETEAGKASAETAESDFRKAEVKARSLRQRLEEVEAQLSQLKKGEFGVFMNHSKAQHASRKRAHGNS